MSDSVTTPMSPMPASGSAPDAAATPAPQTAEVSAATVKFKSCRWRRPPEDGPECCGHRDVLPIAGTSFNPDAWCPDCQFFKLRRTPKKRSPEDYRY
jgi:hypothetical protein